TVPKQDSLAVTVLVLVEAGSKYEAKDINGISHFLEHMCFKGTKKRLRAIDIFSELDGIGASYNAFTSLECTGYYVKAEPKRFDIALDVVSDIYLNQTLDVEEINKERGVIIEEINMYEDLPMRKVQDMFLELLYGDQPAGWEIAGRKEVVQKLTRDDFLKYKREHYLSQSTIVVVAGQFSESEAVEKVKQAFSQIKSSPKSGKERTKEEQENPKTFVQFKETDQAHLVVGVRAFDIFDKRRYALEVLSDILGGGMSSRLFQKIREEMGAAYYVHSSADLYTDHGYLAAACGIDKNKINEVVAAILEEFRKLAGKPVEQGELQRAKDHLVGGMMLSLETSDALANFCGGQEVLTGKTITPQELADNISAVTSDDIMSVAQDIFKNDRLNLALIGPFKDKNEFDKLLRL
ncbi:MAG: pitrilysin family protein, partial [Patescibacteria group bacterium]